LDNPVSHTRISCDQIDANLNKIDGHLHNIETHPTEWGQSSYYFETHPKEIDGHLQNFGTHPTEWGQPSYYFETHPTEWGQGVFMWGHYLNNLETLLI
jgi:hypothetical protein